MANILRPLQVESPFQTLHSASSAVGAYEQLLGIRAKNDAAAREQQRKALIQKLAGPALAGDSEALNMLQGVAPKELMEMQQMQSDILKAQADAEKKQVDAARAAQSFDRNSMLQGIQAARGIVKQLEDNPGDQALWDQIRARATFDGLVEEGTLGDEFPTPEEIDDFKRQLNIAENLAQDHVAVNELKGAAVQIAASEGFGTPAYRRKMQQYTDALISKQYGQKEPLSTLPPGVSLLRDGAVVTQRQRTEFRRTAARVAPILSTINQMNTFMEKYGRTISLSDAHAMGMLMSTALGMLLKEGFEMGALDKGVERQLEKLVPKDPGAWRQGKARGQLDTLYRNIADQLHKKARINNLQVDVDEFLGDGVASGENPSGVLDVIRGMTPEQRKQLNNELTKAGVDPRSIFKLLRTLRPSDNIQMQPAQGAPQQPVQPQRVQPRTTPGGAALIPTPAQPGEGTQTPGSETRQEEIQVTKTETVEPRELSYTESLGVLYKDIENIPKTRQGKADWVARKIVEGNHLEALRDVLTEHAGGNFRNPKRKKRYLKALKVIRREERERKQGRGRREAAPPVTPQAPQEPVQAPQAPSQGRSPEQGANAPQTQPQPVVMRPGDPKPELVHPVMRPGDPKPELVHPVMRPGDPKPTLILARDPQTQAVQPAQKPLDYMRDVDERARRRGEQPQVRPEYKSRVQRRLEEARRQAAQQRKQQPTETREQRRLRLRKERIEARKARARARGRQTAIRVTRGMFPLLSDEEKRRVIQSRRSYQQYMEALDAITPELPAGAR